MSDGRGPEGADRRTVPILAASALLLVLEGGFILAAAFPGGPGELFAPASGRAAYARRAEPAPEGVPEASPARRALDLENLKRLTPEEAALAAWRWARETARGGSLSDSDVAGILPDAAFFLARTASLSDVDDIRLSADGSDAFSRAYDPVAKAMPGSNAAGARVEAVLDVVWSFTAEGKGTSQTSGGRPGLRPPLAPEECWIPPREELRLSHRNALDIFFRPSGFWGSVQKGPVVRSMSSGIVVAAAGDWSGGAGPEKFRRGGLSPRAGNGAVIYDPRTRRYYTYLHLHDVGVRPGQAVEPGAPLGHGGNTGTNARRRGHGGHLHLEIFDSGTNETLDCYALRDLILSL